MDDDHEEGLDEQRGAEAGAEPVEDLEDAGDEHNQGDIEGEAGRAAGAVDAVDLVGIAGDGARGDAVGASVCTIDHCDVARRTRLGQWT